jgi:UDP-4-amino-4-deoxy-L-arabinose-oxoglutarate aminotransferase
MTWVSTVNLIVLAGATPVFVDVDKNNLMVTSEGIEERLTGHARLVVPVHFAGAAADMQPIRDLAEKKGVFVIEDAAHALGTTYHDEPIGKRGTSVFSFHPIKNITTGEGGMVCSDSEDFADRIRRLKFHGLGVDAYDRRIQGRAPQAEVQEPGYKYNMPDVLAALGLCQLARIEEINRKRSELAHRYRQRLDGVEEILPLVPPAYPMTHAWHLFVVRLDVDKAGISRDDFMSELKRRNIGTGYHFKAVHLHKYYREKLGLRRGALPNTEWNSDRICSLPLFPAMTPDDVDQVVETIKNVLVS